ncbi:MULTISPECIES: alpha/beta hydrolase family protein [Pseudofrankia]|uniref:alpha/beta hydrolase family protein n=1 Tax=Pseudofrankia TaxID=2994363 RepID=UPI000234C7B2|nr:MULTISPECIES: dienelactone hydrolase family protein [Pseudofrankia]
MVHVTQIVEGLRMSPLEVLLVLGAVALVVARWLPAAARRPLTFGSVATVALSGLVLGVVGLRWQVVPVLVGAAAAAPFALAPLLPLRDDRSPRRAPWWLALPGSALCLGLIASGPATAWALPRPVFPKPSGSSAVGTSVVQWTDPARAETATADPHDRRTVVVQLWYPARQSPAGAQRAPYLGRTQAEARTVSDALAHYVGVPGFLLDGLPRARTHAVPDAPPAPGGERFPIVLFSPGAGGVRTQNTAWAEELASHGYVVAALDHPYDSAAVVLTDGRVIRTRLGATSDRAEGENQAASATAIRAADLSFVLTQLDRVEHGQIPGPLSGRLDTARVAVTGHSFGGSAALQAAHQDPRFAAVIDLDGYSHDPTPRPYHQPALALTSTIGTPSPDYLPRLTKVLSLSAGPSYLLTVPGAAHLTFTDAPLYLPPVPSIVGSPGRTGGLRVTAGACLAFLDHVLLGRPGDTADALSSYGDLSVVQPDSRR